MIFLITQREIKVKVQDECMVHITASLASNASTPSNSPKLKTVAMMEQPTPSYLHISSSNTALLLHSLLVIYHTNK